MDKQTIIRILYEIYNMLLEMERKGMKEDYPNYDISGVIEKVKNHLDYFIEVEK